MSDLKRLSLLSDYYEFTMANGFYEAGLADRVACFDMFFRRVPDNGGFAIMAGLQQVIDYLKDLHFTAEEISFLNV